DLESGEHVGEVPRLLHVAAAHGVADEVAELELERVERLLRHVRDTGFARLRIVSIPDAPVAAGDVRRAVLLEEHADRLRAGGIVEPDHEVAAARNARVRIATRSGAEPNVVGDVVIALGAIRLPRERGRDAA